MLNNITYSPSVPSTPLSSRIPALSPQFSALPFLLRIARTLGLVEQNTLPEHGLFQISVSLGPSQLTLCCHADFDPTLQMVCNEDDNTQRLAYGQLLLHQALESLEKLNLGKAELTDIKIWADAPPTVRYPVIRLPYGDEGEGFCCIPVASDASLCVAAAHASARITACKRISCLLQMQLIPRLCTQHYQAQRLASLRAEDILLAPIVFENGCYSATLRCGSADGNYWHAQGLIQGNTFTIQAPPFMTYDTTPTATPTAISQLEVPVQLELDPVILPLHQLEELSEGHVLELTTPIDSATVRLMVYGQEIGSGQLVSVGDHLGIRLSGVQGMNHDVD